MYWYYCCTSYILVVPAWDNDFVPSVNIVTSLFKISIFFFCYFWWVILRVSKIFSPVLLTLYFTNQHLWTVEEMNDKNYTRHFFDVKIILLSPLMKPPPQVSIVRCLDLTLVRLSTRPTHFQLKRREVTRRCKLLVGLPLH